MIRAASLSESPAFQASSAACAHSNYNTVSITTHLVMSKSAEVTPAYETALNRPT
jgi:hypothetical protein